MLILEGRVTEQYKRYSQSKKRGCPVCAGNHPKACRRCNGKLRMCDWIWLPSGLVHISKMSQEQIENIKK